VRRDGLSGDPQAIAQSGNLPGTDRQRYFCGNAYLPVYLTDTRAYKLKKPLNLGFLDFSTLERRGFFCAEEVRLNRRFAPDLYLGVAELRSAGGCCTWMAPAR